MSERFGGRSTLTSYPAHRPANRASSKRNRSPEYHRPAAMAEETKHLETARADRSVWLMKCPTVVSRAWQEAAAAAASSSSEVGGANPNPNPNPVVAKVVLSLDPFRSDDQSLQFKMEMAQKDNGNTPKSYSLNMFKDFVPMCVFSESNQG